jgi:predicted NUDIX family NTP pyrophosphohydrolase
MKKTRVSAGLMLYRIRAGQLEVFLAHPGGPFYTRKDAGHWTIPKGETEAGEELLDTAIREFGEETGLRIDPASRFVPLGAIQQKGGKHVHAWAVERNEDVPQPIRSNMHEMEWPPGSGRLRSFPEVDRAEFFPVAAAKQKIKDRQVELIERLEEFLARGE